MCVLRYRAGGNEKIALRKCCRFYRRINVNYQMQIVNRVLNGAAIMKPTILGDDRGYFFESFNERVFQTQMDMKVNFLQDNQSLSSKGTLRGIHFQKGEAAQAKLVRVAVGRAFDVAVDLRPGSPTFKKWHGVELTAENHLQFFIPRGFGHAFVALEDDTVFQYKVDNYYSSTLDGGVLWNDPELNIAWPEERFVLSSKDSNLPTVSELDFTELW